MGIIPHLEELIKKPVITSNQAAMWHALRLSGINDNCKTYGRLFALA